MSTRTQMLAAMFGSGGAKDDEWENVALLLNAETGDPADAAQNTTYADSSGNAITITEGSTSGNPYTQTSFGPFGTQWSLTNDNNSGRATISSATVVPTTGAFTLELFFRSTVAAAEVVLAANRATSYCAIQIVGNGQLSMASSGASSFDIYSAQSMGTISDGNWHHIAIVRDGSNNFATFLDGARTITGTVSATLHTGTNFDLFHLNGSSTWNGIDGYPYVSSLRVTNTAVYDPTSTTLTVPTEKLTAISGTQLLTAQDGKVVDNSSNDYDLANVFGSIICTAESPFPVTTEYNESTLGGSAFSNNRQASIHYTSGTAVGTTNFTIEGFFYFTVLSDYRYSTLFCLNENSAYGVFVQHDNVTGLTNLYVSSNGSSYDIFNAQDLGFTLLVGQWQHHALVRDGTTWSYYVDGTRVWTATASATLATGSQNSAIGGRRQDGGGSGQHMRGYVSNFRFSLTARYSGTSLTVPTAPLSTDGSTQLLCLFANGGILDATAKGVAVLAADTQIDTAQSKFGTRSIYFDGTGDNLTAYLPEASGLLNLGTGDFTFEGFFRLEGAGRPTGYQDLIDFRNTSNSIAPLVMVDNSTGTVGGTAYSLVYYENTTARITGTTTVTSDVWHHVALTRASGTTRLFLNGLQQGSNYADATSYENLEIKISGTNSVKGWADGVRLTRGVARYTAAFTPPTEAFPTRG